MGIETAVRKSGKRPDLIYHLGDWGKEPMVLVFGKNPAEVLGKIRILLGA